jgi:hypothetical protein
MRRQIVRLLFSWKPPEWAANYNMGSLEVIQRSPIVMLPVQRHLHPRINDIDPCRVG